MDNHYDRNYLLLQYHFLASLFHHFFHFFGPIIFPVLCTSFLLCSLFFLLMLASSLSRVSSSFSSFSFFSRRFFTPFQSLRSPLINLQSATLSSLFVSSSPTSSFTRLSHSPLLSTSFIRGRKDTPRKKLKSHSGSKKRFKFTKSGKIFRKQAGLSHKTGSKPRRKKRPLKGFVEVAPSFLRKVRRSLPYGMKFR